MSDNCHEWRQSMDRFGDDLCEVIVDYLPIGDKLRYECISKQFKRLLFNRHRVLVFSEFSHCVDNCHHNLIQITTHHKRDNRLRHILNHCLLPKFKSLREIRFEFNCVAIDGDLLEHIQRHCHRLEIIHFKSCVFDSVDTESMVRFGQTVGHRLKGLSFESCVWRSCDGQRVLTYQELDQLLVCLLRSTPHLKWFRYNADPYRFQWYNYLQLLATDKPLIYDNLSLKNLSEINISYGIDYQTIRRFSDIYCQQIRTICLTLNASDFQCHQTSNSNELNETLRQISRYESLSKLSLTIKHKNCKKQYFIDSGLKEISELCPKLTQFEFNLFTESTGSLLESTKLLDVLTQFPALTECRLKNLKNPELNQLEFQHNIPVNDDSVGCFTGAVVNHHLRRLSLQISSLCDDHFHDIHHCLPRLQSIQVSSDRVLSDRCVKHLSKLSHLKHLKAQTFNCHLYHITDTGIQKLIRRCLQFQSLVLKCNTSITDKSVVRFIRMAMNRPKDSFKLIFVSQNFNHLTLHLPPNSNLFVKDITKEFFDKYNYF